MTSTVLVLSDTHLQLGARLPDAVLALADRADLVVHAGDASTMDVLDTLASLAPLVAVHGNVEDAAVHARLPASSTVRVEGLTIGVLHDPGPAAGRHGRLCQRLPGCDVIIYGHTHLPEVARTAGGVLIINPGSPTQRRRAPWHSACWLELAAGTIASCDLVNLDTMPAA